MPCGAHRGDSGSASSPSACASAGAAAAPSIQRQVPGANVKPKSAAYATNWPPVIMSVLAVTSVARQRRGLASAMYTGTTTDARPMPRPEAARPGRRARPREPVPRCRRQGLGCRSGARARCGGGWVLPRPHATRRLPDLLKHAGFLDSRPGASREHHH